MNKLFEMLGIAVFMFVIGMGAYSFINLGIFNDFDSAIKIFDDLGWFVSLFALATLFTSYLVVIADTKFYFRLLAIPAWLAFSFSLLIALDQFIGYPYPGVPPKAQVLQYRVLVDEDKTKLIEAWIYLDQEDKTRSYRFPHTIENEEKLYKAMQKKARGMDSETELDGAPPPPLGGQQIDDTPDETNHNIRHAGLPPKPGDDQPVEIGTTTPIKRDNRITIQLPGGDVVEIKPGSSFTITEDGEIEMFSDLQFEPSPNMPGSGRGRFGGGYASSDNESEGEFDGVLDPH